MNTNTSESSLFRIASSQGGYFTALQARHAGFSNKNHRYHVRAGNWIREWRGIYRLSRFPLQEDAQYSLWGVWSQNRRGTPQGVYSHETALALFELSDLQPEKLHLTVPRGYRRHGTIPKVLHLHHANIKGSEYEERMGYRVTKPFRTIADIVRAGTISPEFIKQAVQQALDRGNLTQAQYRALKETPRVGGRLSEIMSENK
jgi:predicted transcriptional regulator of viral defense system